MFKNSLRRASNDRFNEIQQSVLSYATTNAVTMGLDPHDLANLHPLQANWIDFYQKCLNPNLCTKTDKEGRFQAREKLRIPLSFLIEKKIYDNPLVTPTDLVAMTLPLPNNKYRVAKKLNPAEIPAILLQLLSGGVLKMTIQNLMGGTNFPEGAKMLQIKYTLAATAPTDAKEYEEEMLLTTCSGDIKFNSLAQANQPVHLIARWIGAKGQTSGYCQPVTGFILK